MRTYLLVPLFVVFVSTPAYAHRRHHNHHHHHSHEHFSAIGQWHGDYAREKSNALPESESRESEQESRVPVGASPDRQPSPTDDNTAGPIRNGRANALCRQMERLRSLPTSPPSRRSRSHNT